MSDSYTQYTNYCHIKRIRQWRFLAFFILIIAIMISIIFISKDKIGIRSDYIAKIEINGMIIDASQQAQKIHEISENKNIKALIVAVNSPGGTTYDSEILFDALMSVQKSKPVVTYMKNVAASGGYIVSLASERIFAAKNTLTGSIGVLMQAPNFKELMQKLGISVTEVKSSPLKGQPNYFSEPPQAVLDHLKLVVDDTNNWFSELVQQRRKGIDAQNIKTLADGRVFTGMQAVNNKLIDEIGGYREAKKYLIENHKLDAQIEVHDVPLYDNPEKTLIHKFFSYATQQIGAGLKNIFNYQGNNVDGLLSLWHI